MESMHLSSKQRDLLQHAHALFRWVSKTVAAVLGFLRSSSYLQI